MKNSSGQQDFEILEPQNLIEIDALASKLKSGSAAITQRR